MVQKLRSRAGGVRQTHNGKTCMEASASANCGNTNTAVPVPKSAVETFQQVIKTSTLTTVPTAPTPPKTNQPSAQRPDTTAETNEAKFDRRMEIEQASIHQG